MGTFDGAVLRLFVDGREVGSGVRQATALDYKLTDSNDLFIGDYPGCRSRIFIGEIDEPAVWSRALRASEVVDAMTPTAQGPVSEAQTPAGSRPASPGEDPSAGGAAGSRATPPALRNLSVSPRVFRAPSKTRRATHRSATRATIMYTDTQVADSTFTVALVRIGIVAGGRCAAQTQGRAVHGRRCIRLLTLGSFVHADRAGTNRFLVPTSLRGRELTPHRYTLVATPRAHGQTGASVRATFTITG